MKKLWLVLGGAGLVGLVWLIWFRQAPASEEETAEATVVAVRVAPIRKATVRAYVTAFGTVEPAPTGSRPAASAKVAPASPGVVAAVRCAEGDRVTRGAVLFELDSRAADVAAAKARGAVAFAEQNAARERSLLEVDGASQKVVQEAEAALAAARGDLAAAETQQKLLHVTSPLAGTVTRVAVAPGAAVDLGTTLAEIVDLDRLVAAAGVPSVEAAALKPGQVAEVSADRDSPPLGGTLAYVGAAVDEKAGTVPIRVELPAGSGLGPGRLVTVRVVRDECRDCLVVPAASVIAGEDGGSVIAVVADGRATQRAVRTGIREGDLVVVAGEGLASGMEVVTEGAYGLPKETAVRVIAE